MKQISKALSLLLVLVCILSLNVLPVLAETYKLNDSDSASIKNEAGKKYNCTLYMKSTVNGTTTGLFGNYTVKSTGTLTGQYPGVKPSYCEKIKYENTYSFSKFGNMSLTIGGNSGGPLGSVSGSTSSSSRTLSDTYTKSDYPRLYKLDESVSCKAQAWIIYWHYQSASVTYTIRVDESPRSASLSTADNTVIW